MQKGHVAIGTVTGTGALITIPLGFQPDHIEIFNPTTQAGMVWQRGMASNSAIKTVAAGTRTLAVTNAIIPTAGVDGTTARGFSIGADANVNVSTNVMYYKAISNDA
jgi:hypothetical protein